MTDQQKWHADVARLIAAIKSISDHLEAVNRSAVARRLKSDSKRLRSASERLVSDLMDIRYETEGGRTYGAALEKSAAYAVTFTLAMTDMARKNQIKYAPIATDAVITAKKLIDQVIAEAQQTTVEKAVLAYGHD
ncbi:hypothetical protein [Alicyclobacillus fastidiosus]|uniref:Uncharacterized protein n=1 Tax=Alicyclobacillus fastidiosus TaxID=392011 RepID=A0ABV5AIF6_9BACL|nr:hypothetical protein [Alicyclobacillus fastidiosus]WEH11141.1 hypothetical protein PYS47_07960 [Alicyclobacillus fastidiosus]